MNKFVDFFKIKRTYFFQGEGIFHNHNETFSGVHTYSSFLPDHYSAYEEITANLKRDCVVNFHLNKFWRIK